MNPSLLAIARALERDGRRLEAKAIRAVAASYKNMSLADMVALLQGATQPLYSAGRVSQLDMLMGAFRQATATLGRPEPKLLTLLQSAVITGSTAGARMLEAATQTPGLIDAFRLRPDREIDLARGAADRLMRYWGKEQTRLAGEVESGLLEGLERGQSPAQMAAGLRERVGVSRSRAMLIATNETSNAMAAGQKATQRDAGVTHYIWLATKDERTRKSHAARDGKTFAWDDPPEDGHPGEAIRCRCVALAVVD